MSRFERVNTFTRQPEAASNVEAAGEIARQDDQRRQVVSSRQVQAHVGRIVRGWVGHRIASVPVGQVKKFTLTAAYDVQSEPLEVGQFPGTAFASAKSLAKSSKVIV